LRAKRSNPRPREAAIRSEHISLSQFAEEPFLVSRAERSEEPGIHDPCISASY
jgi:hypothetical protein